MNNRKRVRASLGLIASSYLLLALPQAAMAQGTAEPAPAFKAFDIGGKAVSFPSDFKGRIVMLDFWATWCPPCVAEAPVVAKAYARYRDKGFDILGVSLDQANSLDRLRSFTRQFGMPWRQIYDGKYWQARIARLYGIDSIPRALLVDGDTGKVLAAGDDLRGESLAPAIAKALAGKK